jgi:hypothetical protein
MGTKYLKYISSIRIMNNNQNNLTIIKTAINAEMVEKTSNSVESNYSKTE